MLGHVKIYFGKVVNITDEDKLFRCQVVIKGLTDAVETEKLPWYFPWYGINYLPELNDVVPVIIFDDNLSTGFYNRKVGIVDGNLTDAEISDDDYDTYLTIYKRLIDDKQVSLIYSKTNGIEFINGDSKIQIELTGITLFSEANLINITPDAIYFGENAMEASLLGETTAEQLAAIIDHQNNVITQMLSMFQAAATAASAGPFTAAIGAALTPLITAAQTALTTENTKLATDNEFLLSEKVFIE